MLNNLRNVRLIRGKGGESMREIISNFLDELEALIESTLDEGRNFIKPYDEEILNILTNYVDKLYEKVFGANKAELLDYMQVLYY